MCVGLNVRGNNTTNQLITEARFSGSHDPHAYMCIYVYISVYTCVHVYTQLYIHVYMCIHSPDPDYWFSPL